MNNTETKTATPENDQVVSCSNLCKELINQITTVYDPHYVKTEDMFVTYVQQEARAKQKAAEYSHPEAVEVNSLIHSIACWMLSRTRLCTSSIAMREVQLGLNALEVAAAHFTKGLKLAGIEEVSSAIRETKKE